MALRLLARIVKNLELVSATQVYPAVALGIHFVLSLNLEVGELLLGEEIVRAFTIGHRPIDDRPARRPVRVLHFPVVQIFAVEELDRRPIFALSVDVVVLPARRPDADPFDGALAVSHRSDEAVTYD